LAAQLYWEDIDLGTELPPLSKVATTRMLVQWAGASGDFVPLHYDDTFARAHGFPGVIVHGALKRQWLVQLVTSWIGDNGTLKKFSCQYRTADFPRTMKTLTGSQDGDTWLCKGKVTKKYVQEFLHFAECDIWVGNGKDEITVQGKASVILPSRS
jgi:hypothetical protein